MIRSAPATQKFHQYACECSRNKGMRLTRGSVPRPIPDSEPLVEMVPVDQVLSKLVSEVLALVSLAVSRGCAVTTLSRKVSRPFVLRIATQYLPAVIAVAGRRTLFQPATGERRICSYFNCKYVEHLQQVIAKKVT